MKIIKFLTYILVLLYTAFSWGKNADIFINAGKLEYDKIKDIIIAQQNVEFSFEQNILLADKIIYNKGLDEVQATGNVVWMNDKQLVMFADELLLSEKLKKGIIKALEFKLSDQKSIITSKCSNRELDGSLILQDNSYTRCKCDENGPIWQIKSKKTVINHDQTTIEHYNSWLEVANVPVFYMPFFRHPGPKATRQSGILNPVFGHSSNLGIEVNIPYYHVFKPNLDMTVTLRQYTKQKPMLINELRYANYFGSFNLANSFTKNKDIYKHTNKLKGHVKANANLSWRDWYVNSQFYRVNDKTYLARYKFEANSTNYLTSNISFNRFNGFDSYHIDNFRYQNLSEDYKKLPTVLPSAEFENYFFVNDGYFINRFNILSLQRSYDRDLIRLSDKIIFNYPFKFNNGLIGTFNNSMRADIYKYSNRQLVSRFIPQTLLKLEYPLYRQNIQLTPQVQLVYNNISGANLAGIINEDSSDIEINDGNLFNPNHYSGIDRNEHGFRIIYGIDIDTQLSQFDKQMGLFIGQMYHKNNVNFSKISGINELYSDYVGRYYIRLNKQSDLYYRFRFNHRDFSWRRNEVGLIYNDDPLLVNFGFNAVDQGVNGKLRKQKSLRGEFSYKMYNYHLFSSFNNIITNKKYNSQRGMVDLKLGIKYEGDCINSKVELQRDYINDRDNKPETSFKFQIGLKTITDK